MATKHTYDEAMKCIRCRRPYAEKATPCDGVQGSRNMGALARRNAHQERREAAQAELAAFYVARIKKLVERDVDASKRLVPWMLTKNVSS